MRPPVLSPIESRIVTLAEAQHGVVARAQLLSLGLTEGAVARRMRAARLHRVHRGVYAVGHAVLSREGHWMAAVLACGPGAVLSHRDAAALWNLRGNSAAARVDVTIPRGSGHRSTPRIRVHLTRRLDSTVVRGIPVTSVARTLADLAEVLPARGLEKAFQQAFTLRLLDARDVAALPSGRPGPARVGALPEEHELGGGTRSGLEDAFLALRLRHGIPRPVVNGRVGGFEVDFHWPEARLIVETDTFRFHGGRSAFTADRARDRALAVRGWHTVRATDAAIYGGPGALAADILHLLNARSPSPSTRG